MDRIFKVVTLVVAFFLVLNAALWIADDARADDEGLWLTSGEWSRHTDESKHNYRQNNTGGGLQYDLSENQSIVTGYYENSVHRGTFYMGATYTPLHFYGFKVGGVFAMATGYAQFVPAVPIGGFYTAYTYQRAGINFMWLPHVVAAVQLKWRIE
jgi:hypothetical protein